MNKTTVVVFNENGVRILINPDKAPKGAIINPDLTHLKGVPPHLWKLENGKITSDYKKTSAPVKFLPKKKKKYWLFLLTIPVAAAIWYFTHIK